MEPIMSNTGTDNALFYIQSVSVRFFFSGQILVYQ